MPNFADDPEPNAHEDPVNWLLWGRRQDERQRLIDQQQRDNATLGSFVASAEQAARAKEPGYDDALAYFRKSLRTEYEMTGELTVAAERTLAAAAQDRTLRGQLSRLMTDKNLTEQEAAEEIVLATAFAQRTGDMVRAQHRRGGNPALTLVEAARARGWRGQPTLPRGESRTSTDIRSVFDEPLREPARTQQPTRAWSRNELDALDPAARRQAIRDIAAAMDDTAPLTPLSSFVRR